MVPVVRPRCRSITDDGHLALWQAALGVLLAVPLAAAVDLDDQTLGQCVHDRHAHTVQTARDLVAVATELAAGVQHGQHDLGGTLATVFTGGERIDGHAASVVVDLTSAVGEQGDTDPAAVTGHGFVDRIVDDFPDEVMQSRQAGGADVHARPLAHRIEPLEHLDRRGVVHRCGLALIGVRSSRSRGWRGDGFGNFGRVVGHSYLVSCKSVSCKSVSCRSCVVRRCRLRGVRGPPQRGVQCSGRGTNAGPSAISSLGEDGRRDRTVPRVASSYQRGVTEPGRSRSDHGLISL